MGKNLAVCFAVMFAGSLAVAQPDTTTATAQAADATTNTVVRNATTTNPAASLFTPEAFEARWKLEEKFYREAGIPEEKINKLHELNSRVWKARADGGKADFQAIMKERAGVLTAEEAQKVRDVRRKQIEEQLGMQIRQTSGSVSSAEPGTSVTAHQ